MPEQPRVTVLMAVFNCASLVSQAVQSILDQTFHDFEFLIIDDGSVDGSREALAGIRDPRVRLLLHEKNVGLSRSLNAGMALARGCYVARMDADDIAFPQRLERQVAFLETYPDVGLLGSACLEVNSRGRELAVRPIPTDDLHIRWTSLLNNPFLHPTVMMRRDILLRHGLTYDERFQAAQDYDLWTRMLRYTQGSNLSEPLVRYRLHHGVTSIHREVQLKNHDLIALRTVQEQLPDCRITIDQVSQLRALFVGGREHTPLRDDRRMALADLYLDLLMAFVGRHVGAPGLKSLQNKEAVKVARVVLGRPLQPGWIHVLGRLMAMNPRALWSIVGHCLKALVRRIRRDLPDSQPISSQ